VTNDVPVLGLSGLFVMVSIKVFPAWCSKHRSSDVAIRVFSVLALAATIAATAWLTWQVASLGVQHSPSHPRAQLYGTAFGVPVVLIPLAILLAIVAVAEIRSGGVPSPSFSFGKRKDAEMLETIRGQIAGASTDSRAVLADAISQIESSVSARIEERSRLQASTGTAVETLHSAVTESASDVADTFERVANLCATVAARIEAHQLEPDPLAEVIERLASAPAIALVPAPVAEPAPAPAVVTKRPQPDDVEISLVDEEEAEDGVAVHADPTTSPDPVMPSPPDDNPPPAALTTVERLRQQAQRVSREVFTRGKSQPSRMGRRPTR